MDEQLAQILRNSEVLNGLNSAHTLSDFIDLSNRAGFFINSQEARSLLFMPNSLSDTDNIQFMLVALYELAVKLGTDSEELSTVAGGFGLVQAVPLALSLGDATTKTVLNTMSGIKNAEQAEELEALQKANRQKIIDFKARLKGT